MLILNPEILLACFNSWCFLEGGEVFLWIFYMYDISDKQKSFNSTFPA
jgi:hypothetical protein